MAEKKHPDILKMSFDQIIQLILKIKVDLTQEFATMQETL